MKLGADFYFEPGCGRIEVIAGNMKAGKTEYIEFRENRVRRMEGLEYVLFKPATDTRNTGIISRNSQERGRPPLPCQLIDPENPEMMLDHLIDGVAWVAVDEVQFFNPEAPLIQVVQEMVLRNIHVTLVGLNLDYRGREFGQVPRLLGIAHYPIVIPAICDVPRCHKPAFKPQRLRNGQPEHWDAPTIIIEGSSDDIKYEARCDDCHVVEGMPRPYIERKKLIKSI